MKKRKYYVSWTNEDMFPELSGPYDDLYTAEKEAESTATALELEHDEETTVEVFKVESVYKVRGRNRNEVWKDKDV